MSHIAKFLPIHSPIIYNCLHYKARVWPVALPLSHQAKIICKCTASTCIECELPLMLCSMYWNTSRLGKVGVTVCWWSPTYFLLLTYKQQEVSSSKRLCESLRGYVPSAETVWQKWAQKKRPTWKSELKYPLYNAWDLISSDTSCIIVK